MSSLPSWTLFFADLLVNLAIAFPLCEQCALSNPLAHQDIVDTKSVSKRVNDGRRAKSRLTGYLQQVLRPYSLSS